MNKRYNHFIQTLKQFAKFLNNFTRYLKYKVLKKVIINPWF